MALGPPRGRPVGARPRLPVLDVPLGDRWDDSENTYRSGRHWIALCWVDECDSTTAANHVISKTMTAETAWRT